MALKSVTFRRHDHLVSMLFEDLLSHSYNITFSMFLYLVTVVFDGIKLAMNLRSSFLSVKCQSICLRGQSRAEDMVRLVRLWPDHF